MMTLPPFEVPEQVSQMVKKHLGQAAIDVQTQAGRGAWVATVSDQALYIKQADLPNLFGGGDWTDFAEFLAMVERFDPTTQVVVLFNYSEELQFVGVLDAI